MKLIPLTQGKFTSVDDDDFEKFGVLNWHYSHGRAVRKNSRSSIDPHTHWLHREIMGNPVGLLIDHINGNPLDNRKENLRIVNQSLNIANARKQSSRLTSSRYKGVSYSNNPKAKNKWHSYIGAGKTRMNIGMYATEEEAALAYNRAATNRWGSSALLNVIGNVEVIKSCPTCHRPL